MNLQDTIIPFAKIGKSVLVQAIGIQPNYKSIEYIEIIDDSICQTEACPYFELYKKSDTINLLDEKAILCENCKVPVKQIKKTLYQNERHSYKIGSISKRLSKLEIKVLLLYHFMNCDKIGMVKNVSEKEMSIIVGCTTRSIKNVNAKLLSLGYILMSHAGEGKFNIILTEYKKYHLTAKEGGTGYFDMSSETLTELLAINDVNALRLSLRTLLNLDNLKYERILKTEKERSISTYKTIKRYLPEHINSSRKIKELSDKSKEIFNYETFEDSIVFYLKKEHNPELLLKLKTEEYKIIFKESLNHFNTKQSLKSVEDLVQMSIQYGFNRVDSALKRIYQYQRETDEIIENFGGYVRAVIEDNKWIGAEIVA